MTADINRALDRYASAAKRTGFYTDHGTHGDGKDVEAKAAEAAARTEVQGLIREAITAAAAPTTKPLWIAFGRDTLSNEKVRIVAADTEAEAIAVADANSLSIKFGSAWRQGEAWS